MSRKWTTIEIRTLKISYPKKGAQHVAKLLGRSPDAVMAKAAKIGIRYNALRPWMSWEDNYMRRHCNDRRKISMAKTLKRTLPAIMARAKLLKLTGPKAASWSDAEKDILRSMYFDRKHSLDHISEKLSRTRYAVLLQAQVLGLKRPQHDHEWTEKEYQYLVDNFKTKSYREIAEDLGLTQSAVAHYANRSGLRQRERGRQWTEGEKEFVKHNYKKMLTKEIAQKLDRTVNSIITIVGKLGVSAGRPRPWSEDEKEYLKKYYGKISTEEISVKLGRSKQAITVYPLKFLQV